MTGAPSFQGQLCYLLWNTTAAKMTSDNDTDIALLRNETLPVNLVVVSADYRSSQAIVR